MADADAELLAVSGTLLLLMTAPLPCSSAPPLLLPTKDEGDEDAPDEDAADEL